MQEPIEDLISELAGTGATPAGGAAAALSLCHGIALALKVARLTLRRSPGPGPSELVRELETLLERARPAFDEDCRAVRALLAASGSERDAAMEAVMRAPLGALRLAGEAAPLVASAIDRVRGPLAADLGAAADLLHAAASISYRNVRYNAGWKTEGGRWAGLLEEAETAWSAEARVHASVSARLAETGGPRRSGAAP